MDPALIASTKPGIVAGTSAVSQPAQLVETATAVVAALRHRANLALLGGRPELALRTGRQADRLAALNENLIAALGRASASRPGKRTVEARSMTVGHDLAPPAPLRSATAAIAAARRLIPTMQRTLTLII